MSKMKLIMEGWRTYVKEEGEKPDNFDVKTGEPITPRGMEICASQIDCFHNHLVDKIYKAGKEEEFSAIIDIAKAAAEKEGWYPGRHGSYAPWEYEWSNGQAQELKDKRAREAEAVIKDIEAKYDNPDSVDPDANDDGQLSPDALRRIADKVEAGAEEKEEQPAPTMSKIDKLEALKKIDAAMKSGEISDLEALKRMKALKGK
jgi:hypothetical protein